MFVLTLAAWLASACSGDIDGGNALVDAGAAASGLDGGGGNAGSGGLAGSGGAGPGGPQGAGGAQAGRGGSGESGSGGSAGSAGRAGSGGSAGSAGAAGAASDAGMPDAGGSDAGPMPSGDPAVRYLGRPDRRQAGVVRMAWSGSGVLFRFRGTDASLRMDDPAGFFTHLIDGVEQPELRTTPGERSYQVASGLADGEHTIELYRRPEALFGVTEYFEVELGAGELLPPPPPKARQLELIGDSITCGYGNEGTVATCSFEASTENHWLTYGALAARALDAELVTIAWSGKGIVYNYGDDKNEPLPALYARALPGDAQSQWDFAQWQPDVVVINLGTNDFSTDDDPSQSVFENAYVAFLEQLRARYPGAWIVCLAPTGLGGSDLATADAYVTSVVDKRNQAGDARVVAHALEFTSEGAGCDYHPSLETHASMGTALAAELRDLVGW